MAIKDVLINTFLMVKKFLEQVQNYRNSPMGLPAVIPRSEALRIEKANLILSDLNFKFAFSIYS